MLLINNSNEKSNYTTDDTHQLNNSTPQWWSNQTQAYPTLEPLGAFNEFVKALTLVAVPVIVGVGLCGNTLSFLIFIGHRLRYLSSSVYLAFLNLVDNVFLIVLLLVWFDNVRVPVIHQHGICQGFVYLSYITAFLSVWTVVAFTVERFIVVYRPLAKSKWCSSHKARRVALGLVIFAFLFYSFALWTSKLVIFKIPKNTTICYFDYRYFNLLKIMNIIDTVITLIIPSTIIIVLNIAIAIKIWKVIVRREQTLTYPSADTRELKCIARNGGTAGTLGNGVKINSDDKEPVIKNWNEQLLKAKGIDSGSGCSGSSGSRGRRSLSGDGRDVGGPSQPMLTPGQHHPQPPKVFDSPLSSTTFYQCASQTSILQLRTTRTLLAVSTLFLLLNLPSHSVKIYVFLAQLTNSQFRPPRRLIVWQEVVQILYYMNFAANFFLYCACSVTFRCALKRKLLSWINRSSCLK